MFSAPRLLAAFLALAVTTTTLAAGPPDGFRSFPWGSGPTSSMLKITPKANMQGYLSPNEDKNVLGLQADSITYYYFGGGLCRVEIAWWPLEVTALNSIQTNLEKYWGKPISKDSSSGTRIIKWLSESGATSSSLLAMDNSENVRRWYTTIIIQGRECSKSAIEGSGL